MTSAPVIARPRVVLVDDDPAVRSSLAFSLELDGFEVESLASGEALLSHDLSDGALCLVIDQNLPGVSGLEALATLRARRVRAPAILITSNPARKLCEMAAAAGVPIVEKPLLGDELVGDIRKALAS